MSSGCSLYLRTYGVAALQVSSKGHLSFMRKKPTFILCALLGSIAAVFPSSAQTLIGKVVSIADGDTITILDAGHVQHKIRLAGIDAPEIKQAFGQRSKEYLSALLSGQDVVEVETEKQDRYGRSVGKVFSERKDVNLAMVRAGFAWHYKKYQSEQTNSDRALYAAAEEDARSRLLGLWIDERPIPPWEWRSGAR
jgi:endonuclease YncB( thermonuclease family)